MDIEQERAAFERWYVERYGSERGTVLRPNIWPSGIYVADRAQNCWEAYQVGRAALQSQDREDAERWRQFMTGDSVNFSGQTEKGRPWSIFLAKRSLFGWAESFTKAIDQARRIEGDL